MDQVSQLVNSYTGGVVTGQRLKNSAWINSDIEGAMDETTEVRLKDDFHAAVNKEWILSQDISESRSHSAIEESTQILGEQILSLFKGEELTCDTDILPQEQVDHLQEMMLTMVDLAGNWEERNALGVEPLRPYLESIQNIQNLDDLTAYLSGEEGIKLKPEER